MALVCKTNPRSEASTSWGVIVSMFQCLQLAFNIKDRLLNTRKFWNLGRKSLILLLISPLLTILVFGIVPSTGSEWASGYNKLFTAIVAQIIFLVISYVMGWLGVFYSDNYKKPAYFVVSFLSVVIVISLVTWLNIYIL